MTREQIREAIKAISDDEVVAIWNNYRSANKWESIDHKVHRMSEFDDCFSSFDPSDIAFMVEQSKFSTHDAWFIIGDMRVESSDDIWELIDLELLTDYIEYDCSETLEGVNIKEMLEQLAI